MRACKNCRWGDRAYDDSKTTFYWCRAMPPRASDGFVPPMKPHGWCGQFKLAFWRWLKNFVVRGT